MKTRHVLFIQATEPAAYPPLINAAGLFSEYGWRSTFLAAPIAGKTLKLPQIPGMYIESVPMRPSHVMSSSAYLGYCDRAIRLALRLRPGLVYASDPIGALPGLLASRACGAKLIYHEHDSPNHHVDLNPVFRFSRKAASRSAFRIIFPNAERAEYARQELDFNPARLCIVWNVPRRAEIIPNTFKRDHPMVIYYHGSITPERVPKTVAEAAAGFRGRIALRIAGYEAPSSTGYLASLIDQFGRTSANGLIDEIGMISRQDLLQVAAEAHVGLALMPSESPDINMRRMTGASNKAFDYLAAGLPVLVSNLPDWRAFFVDPGYGMACDPNDVESLAAAMRWYAERPDIVRAMGEAGRQRILNEWNYETEFAPVMRALTATECLA